MAEGGRSTAWPEPFAGEVVEQLVIAREGQRRHLVERSDGRSGAIHAEQGEDCFVLLRIV